MERETHCLSEPEHNMQNDESIHSITVVWRGNKYMVEMNSDASLKDLGEELQRLTDVKEDTMKLIVPQVSGKSSKLLSPFSEQHSQLSLQEASIVEGKSVRMMGVSVDEVDKVLQDAKVDLRIAGFDVEERRMRQRLSDRPHALLKLPQGRYIFSDFRTLEIPGVQLNPPASEALKRMHMLAADPGIVAIMSKHRWHVGIMTEMAPVGYVGVSPKCILGFNKNHGEEISLRLRTDDLKGFRKYESIKKTLLHELAHMVYSEHDANFYSLDKQLNQEAASLDWTKSKGHTLSGVWNVDQFEEDFHDADSKSLSQKLGGSMSDYLSSARASSVAAAYHRLANASVNSLGVLQVHVEPDPDNSSMNMHGELGAMDSVGKQPVDIESLQKSQWTPSEEPDPDEHICVQRKNEPDPDDSQGKNCQVTEILNDEFLPSKNTDEPALHNCEAKQNSLKDSNIERTCHNQYLVNERREDKAHLPEAEIEPNPDDSQANCDMQMEPVPVDKLESTQQIFSMQIDEPDPDNQELRRIQDPVTVVCDRLQKAVEMLRAEVNPIEATAALQTLFKIIRNVIEHPDEIKFKRLRKANPIIQKNVANHKAAMEILHMVGFSEDFVFNEIGHAEAYLVLKRNDPGLLWLAKSSLEGCVA